MSKMCMGLKLKDLYAIKHALEARLNQKCAMSGINIMAARLSGNMDFEKQLRKDIAHEESLIKKFETEITDFKEKYKIKEDNHEHSN